MVKQHCYVGLASVTPLFGHVVFSGVSVVSKRFKINFKMVYFLNEKKIDAEWIEKRLVGLYR